MRIFQIKDACFCLPRFPTKSAIYIYIHIYIYTYIYIHIFVYMYICPTGSDKCHQNPALTEMQPYFDYIAIFHLCVHIDSHGYSLAALLRSIL